MLDQCRAHQGTIQLPHVCTKRSRCKELMSLFMAFCQHCSMDGYDLFYFPSHYKSLIPSIHSSGYSYFQQVKSTQMCLTGILQHFAFLSKKRQECSFREIQIKHQAPSHKLSCSQNAYVALKKLKKLNQAQRVSKPRSLFKNLTSQRKQHRFVKEFTVSFYVHLIKYLRTSQNFDIFRKLLIYQDPRTDVDAKLFSICKAWDHKARGSRVQSQFDARC